LRLMSVKCGPLWHFAQLAAPRKSALPRSAAAGSNEPAAGAGAARLNW
jgi:hypothetical protein